MANRQPHFLVGISMDASSLHQEILDTKALLADLRPVFTKAATIMRRSFAANFAAGGRPEKWVPLKPNTVATKNANMVQQGYKHSNRMTKKGIRRLRQLGTIHGAGTGGNILIWDGKLRDSYVQKNANHISRINKDGFQEGSKFWLAQWHEEGTKPYTINTRKARALRFMTVNGTRFAKSVRHPGLPARPVAIIQDEDQEKIMALLEAHLSQ